MKTKKQMIQSEMKEHGSKKRFAAIKKARTPKALAEVIVKQHGTAASYVKPKKCKKCGKVKSKCEC